LSKRDHIDAKSQRGLIFTANLVGRVLTPLTTAAARDTAYHDLDLTPLGRHEQGLSYPMAWLRLRDRYEPLAGLAACCRS
jgi:predicted dithiol-disulfide oxidoreductase (DUF899 family)